MAKTYGAFFYLPVPQAVPEFTVYAGNGQYLQRVTEFTHAGNTMSGIVEFGEYCKARMLDRRQAVSACHAARAAGVPAWVVRHPLAA